MESFITKVKNLESLLAKTYHSKAFKDGAVPDVLPDGLMLHIRNFFKHVPSWLYFRIYLADPCVYICDISDVSVPRKASREDEAEVYRAMERFNKELRKACACCGTVHSGKLNRVSKKAGLKNGFVKRFIRVCGSCGPALEKYLSAPRGVV